MNNGNNTRVLRVRFGFPRFGATNPVRRGSAALLAAGALALGAGLAACSTPSTVPVSASLSCPEATVALANVESRLREAQALVVDVGTPAEKEKEAKVASAQADIDRLTVVKSKACEAGATSTATSSPSATATPSTSTSPTVACNNWAWVPDPHANFAWISGGLQSIRDAKTEQDAVKAAQEWMGHVQNDRANLQAAVKMLLDKDVTPTDLGNDVCASDLAKQYVIQMYMILGQSRITPAEAPTNGTNSGISNGQPYSSTSGEIHGDRKAIKIEVYVAGKLVKTVWVMARCGNGVTLVQIFLPGPTDNNVQICESGPDKGQPVGSDGLCAKDPTQDPQSQGNVPGQSTKNGGSVDNGSEISNGPVKPVDSGNGTGGTPPRATPSSAPTHSGGPTLPSPTEAPEPLPTPQPTQTASVPPPPPPPA